MYRRDSLGFLVLLIVLVLTLAACGGQEAVDTPEPSNTPAPTNTPRPTITPVPTVDTASLTVADLQATVEALEAELEAAEASASGAAGEAEESDAEIIVAEAERRLEEAQALLEAAVEAEGEADETEADAMATAATLTLSGDFEQTQEWGWEDLEALEMITASVAGPGEDDPEAEYTGVSLVALLEAAGIGEEAETLVATAADDFSAEIDLAAAQECTECMIVLEDEDLRLIMPGFPGNNWVSGVVSLEAR